MAVGTDREHHETSGEDGVDGGEGEDRKADPGTGLGGAIDIAPIEQAADQALPPRLRGLAGGFGQYAAGHCRPPDGIAG